MGKSMGVLTKDVTAFLRDLIVAKTCGESANKILALPQSRYEKIAEIADGVNLKAKINDNFIFLKVHSISHSNSVWVNM